MRPREAVKKLVEEKLQVTVGSSEYLDFVRILETEVAKDTKRAVCLTCWTYIIDGHRKLHESHGHQCLAPGKMKDERSFIHYAKLFNYLTWDGLIILVKPLPADEIGRDKLIRMNTISHELKSRRENRGNVKGQPPFLSTPLCNLNMVPAGITSTSISQKKEIVSQTGGILAIKPEERNLGAGQLAVGFTAESRDKLCRILGVCSDEIASI
jgi:hypothetical protein